MYRLIILLKKIYWKIAKKISFVLIIPRRKNTNSLKLTKYNTITGAYYPPKYIYDILVKNVELNSKNIRTTHCALSEVLDGKYLAVPCLKKYRTYGSLELEVSNKKDNENDKILIKQIDDFINFLVISPNLNKLI